MPLTSDSSECVVVNRGANSASVLARRVLFVFTLYTVIFSVGGKKNGSFFFFLQINKIPFSQKLQMLYVFLGGSTENLALSGDHKSPFNSVTGLPVYANTVSNVATFIFTPHVLA